MSSGKNASTLEYQDRDIAFLRSLFESRVMTLAHATALHFGGKSEAAKKRIQKLKAAGVVRERQRRPYEPSVLSLTSQAFKLLHERGQLAAYPHIGIAALEKRGQVSEMTLKHELAVVDIKTAVASAIAATAHLQLAEFTTWPALIQFMASPTSTAPDVVVKPDGYLRLHKTEAEGGVFEHLFFLEVDRSTEQHETLLQKAACYIDYYRRGGLAVRCGASPERYKEFPFRVLFVFNTAERRNNMAERLLANRPPILTQALLTTRSELVQNALGSIWIRPAEYRDTVQGTAFEVFRQDQTIYRRQSEREILVEKRIQKRHLLDD